MNTLECKKPTPCVTDPVEPTRPEPSAAFEFCAGDYTIQWDGYNLYKNRTRNTVNGTYDRVSVVDGCVVGYSAGDVPTYTPPYCNPAPAPCGEGEANTGGVTISPTAGNILKQDVLGLYARAYITGGDNVKVTGTGTQDNPLRISVPPNTVTRVTGVGSIEVKEPVPNNYSVELKNSGITAGNYGGFQVSEKGIITGYVPSSEGNINSVSPGLEINTSLVNGVLTISHPQTNVQNLQYTFGGYTVGISDAGHITNVTPAITVPPGNYAMGAYTISITQDGSISGITTNPVPSSSGSFSTVDGKYIQYDATGRIVSASSTPPPSGQTTLPHTPITDMYELRVFFDGPKADLVGKNTSDYTNIKVFGNAPSSASGKITATSAEVQLRLPYYVTSSAQVQVTEIDSSSMTSAVYNNGVMTITASTMSRNVDGVDYIKIDSIVRFVLRV